MRLLPSLSRCKQGKVTKTHLNRLLLIDCDYTIFVLKTTDFISIAFSYEISISITSLSFYAVFMPNKNLLL